MVLDILSTYESIIRSVTQMLLRHHLFTTATSIYMRRISVFEITNSSTSESTFCSDEGVYIFSSQRVNLIVQIALYSRISIH